MTGEQQDRPGVIIFPPLLFLICVIVGLIVHVFALDHWSVGWSVRLFGMALAVGGFMLARWGRGIMEAAGTNVRPNLPATTIVSEGPFAFTRNPLYLGLLTIYAGLGIALASPAFLAVIVPFFLILHFGAVLREERYLEAKFGDVYLAYKARVRRWV